METEALLSTARPTPSRRPALTELSFQGCVTHFTDGKQRPREGAGLSAAEL